MRTITPLIILTGALLSLALAGPSLARDMTLPKTTAEQLKAACDKAGGKFSQGQTIYGCGTDCKGGPGTDCTVNCVAGKRCTAQVVGGRRPHTVAAALTKAKRH